MRSGWATRQSFRISTRQSFRIPHPRSWAKATAIKAMQRRTGARNFIETGTYLGVTTRRCASRFKSVYTIELDPALAAKASAWLSGLRNVSVIQGDAADEVRKLMDDEKVDRVLLFLDGHFGYYSGVEMEMGEVIEPAVDILDYLATKSDQIDGIIVDDFREFGSPGWPSKSALIRAAEAFEKKGFRMRVHFDQLFIERTPAGRQQTAS